LKRCICRGTNGSCHFCSGTGLVPENGSDNPPGRTLRGPKRKAPKAKAPKSKGASVDYRSVGYENTAPPSNNSVWRASNLFPVRDAPKSNFSSKKDSSPAAARSKDSPRRVPTNRTSIILPDLTSGFSQVEKKTKKRTRSHSQRPKPSVARTTSESRIDPKVVPSTVPVTAEKPHSSSMSRVLFITCQERVSLAIQTQLLSVFNEFHPVQIFCSGHRSLARFIRTASPKSIIVEVTNQINSEDLFKNPAIRKVQL
jgi:hypothetical protein